MIDLLYYPDGVAYLLPERETFQWTSPDVHEVAKRLAQAIREKQVTSLHQFVTISQLGIRVSSAAIESGASYHDLLYAIRKRVDGKVYTQKWLDEYNQRLLADIKSATTHADDTVSTLAKCWLEKTSTLVPLDQQKLKCGDMLLAYRNLLHDHLRKKVQQKSGCDAWTYVYRLLDLPPENDVLYEQVDHYRRYYFLTLDCELPLDALFERCLSDIAELVDEQEMLDVDGHEFYNYLAVQLEFQGSGTSRDFKAHLQRYQKDRNKQCCMCSSAAPGGKLMDAEVPDHLGVQVFSNRLKGGGREPKRYVCPLCRTQLILEKLTRTSFKKGKAYTNFYLHLYPYAFFSAPYLNALYRTLKGVVREGHESFFLKRDRYYRRWQGNFETAFKQRLTSQIPPTEIEEREQEYLGQATIINGISVPPFSEAVSNTPTLPLNAPGTNYAQQFLFAFTHALMIADFFGCRVVLSQMPFPVLSSDYLAEHELAFFVDGVPLHLRWLVPANEYRSLETYREGTAKGGGTVYQERREQWAQERLDEQGYGTFEHLFKRLSFLYEIAQQLQLNPEESEDFLFEASLSLADNPFSLYRLVDLTIERQIRGTRSASEQTSQKRSEKTNKQHTKGVVQPNRPVSPESRATFLSKRVAPLLAQIIKE